ncbi:GCN5-related N-acetyltransferase [Shewanella sp. MR-4]|uniref:GNAT family N-acetyltransferase n=1 Tax=Shewanella sp. (strain MR-4) TaxID=60480 RepID=UPI00005E53F7|nr:GNAT family N-acetyltransferase [Shewanella sp. MR-4]ABI37408.1 GCN5-related N-acetyltransferase [Shewanella sp. MR-4]
MKIILDDLKGPEIAALLTEHLEDMRATSPPESVHALDLDGLRQPNIRFWTLWDGRNLAGCGALKWLDAEHAEIKSMRTAATYKQQGIASKVLQHLINDAKAAGVQRLSLETGSMAFFQPARRLYCKFGFEICGPFDGYQLDPNSVFMTKKI